MRRPHDAQSSRLYLEDFEAMRDSADRLKALNAELAEALRQMLAQTSSIEVLGEWSAMDTNRKSGAKLRAEVDSVIATARAALAKHKEESP